MKKEQKENIKAASDVSGLLSDLIFNAIASKSTYSGEVTGLDSKLANFTLYSALAKAQELQKELNALNSMVNGHE